MSDLEKTKYKNIVLAFTGSPKVGKTTLAVNLAILLASKKQKVAILDADIFSGDVSYFFGYAPTNTLSELVGSGEEISYEAISSFFYQIDGIDILNAPKFFHHASSIKPEDIRTIILLLKNHYDFVIVDCPSFNSELNIEIAFEACNLADKPYIVSKQIVTYLKDVQRFRMLTESLDVGSRSRLVLMDYSNGSFMSDSEVEEISRMKISFSTKSDLSKAETAINTGIPLIKKSSFSPIVKTCKNIMYDSVQNS